ncbi:MAG: hypothetical protein ACLTER_17125 [Ruminococcus sp.]
MTGNKGGDPVLDFLYVAVGLGNTNKHAILCEQGWITMVALGTTKE